MTTYAIGPDRELDVNRAHGLVLLDVRAPDGSCISGPLAIREPDLAAFAAAIAREAGGELAADLERVRELLRASPGIRGYDQLRAALAGMSMKRRRAAVTAIRDGGEILDRGAPGRPRLHLAEATASYSHGNPPHRVEVALSPCQAHERADSDPYDASRAHAGGEADVTSTGGTP